MNILLPTDFSENAKNAAAYALKCFEHIPCTFHFLHALPVSTRELNGGKVDVSAEFYPCFEQLFTFLNSKKVNPQHELKVVFKTGPLIEEVREQVFEHKIDLIIMGTKGTSNNENNTIGKNTSEVITKVKCPVLAISEDAVFQEFKEILFPTDYKINYSGQMLQMLFKFVSVSKANVKILEIFNSDLEPTKEQMESKTHLQNYFLPQIPLSQPFYTSSKIQGNPSPLLNNKVDMIALAAKNLDICQKLLNGNRSQQIPFMKQLPLLVLH